ncbi:hypothetical protein [Nocardioides sp. SR21]|uniref:hypothetical protein n=1 Tax=Nocardioides sp. SR21 TaxID=2919501 RepID=UPI001FA99F4E|nr:hypothetical protein [Nocardioides sp. SR21]
MTNKPDPATTAELEALRAEVARLQAQEQEQSRRTGWWRPVVSGVLILLLAVLLPLGVVARWVHNEVADTDRYVESIEPLAQDPAIQSAVADKITAEIMTRLQVEAVTEEAVKALADLGLPPLAATSLQALSTPLNNAISGFVEDKVLEIVESSRFQQAWVEANREAHAQLVTVLTGEGSDLVDVTDNTVAINLGPVVDQVKERLVESGFSLAGQLPAINLQLTLFQSDDLATAQSAFRVLNGLNTALPIVALLLLGGAVAVARSRRRALITAALASAASMLLLGVALNAFRVVYLDAIPTDVLPQDAAAAFYDNMVWFIRLNLRAILVLTLAIAFIAWVSGTGRNALALRRGTSGAIAWARGGGNRVGLNTGRFGVFLDANRTMIRIVVLGLALLLYAMADHPTGGFTITLLVVAGVLLLIVELLARPAEAAAGPADAVPPPPAPGPS